jgi:hypothetical protein
VYDLTLRLETTARDGSLGLAATIAAELEGAVGRLREALAGLAWERVP